MTSSLPPRLTVSVNDTLSPSSLMSFSFASLARTAIILTFAFSGIESALVPGGEVRDPSRTVPRSIFLAMGSITVLYLLLQTVSRGILGDDLSTATTAPLAEAAGRAMGSWARTVLLVGASVSMSGHAGGMMLALSRVLFALARDGFLPRQVAAGVVQRWQLCG